MDSRVKFFFASMRSVVLRACFCYVVLSPLASFGQLVLQGYLELDAPQAKIDFTIIPAKENGIVLIGKKGRLAQARRDWSIMVLDTNLNKNEVGSIKLVAGYDLAGYEVTAEHVFFLFDDSEQASGVFQLIKLKFLDYSLERFEINHGSELSLTHFSVVDNSALFGGQIAQKTVVLLYNMKAKKLIAVPGFFEKKHQLLNLRVNENGTFTSLMVEENMFQMKHIVTKVFSQQGHLLLKDSVKIKEKIKILSGMASGLKRNDLMIVGTYARQSSKRALGFYALPIDPLNNQPIQYFPFPLFDHFLDYMGLKKAIKLKEKGQSRVESGKSTNYSAYLQPIKIQEEKAGFFLSAEMLNGTPTSDTQANSRVQYNIRSNSYIPFYRTPSYPSRYYNPNELYSHYSNNEVEYIQSVLALFNAKGELVWDTSISMKRLKYRNQMQVSDFIIKNKSAWLVYKKEGKLFVNAAADSVSRLDTLAISSSNEILYEYPEGTGVEKWYDGHFCVWGYRDIRYNTTGEEKNHVLYIGKFGIL